MRLRLVLIALTLAALPLAGGAPKAGTFQITLLGTGNPRPTPDRLGPSILIEAGGHALLIDAGRGASERLFEIGARDLLTSVETLFLTHLHSDHTVGLPDLWLTSWVFGRAKALEVVGPPGTAAMARHLEAAYAWDLEMRGKDEGFPREGARLLARDAEPGVVYERDGLGVTAFAVDHGGATRPAYGYRIDYRGRSAVFSGDTRYFEPLGRIAAGVDVLVHEVISPDVELRRAQVVGAQAVERVIAHHTSPEQAGRIFAAAKPRLAVYSHIVPSPATAEDLIGPTRTTFSGPLLVGYDLMTIVIGETIETYPRTTLSDR